MVATVFCLSVVCNILCIVAKRCILPKSSLKKQIGNGYGKIERSRDRWRHVSPKGHSRDPIRLEPNISETAGDATLQQLLDSLLWGSIQSAILATAWLLVLWVVLPALCCDVIGGVVLDEATSQVGVAMERHLYSTCARLKITVLSVGHRDSLREFHHLELHIGDLGSWQLHPIDSSTSSDQISVDIESMQF